MKSRILLIEDEADLGNVVRQYLEIMDFEVDWCQDGQLALQKIQTTAIPYHILLIDVSLSGMDGFDLASNIVKLNIQVPFLFLTARGEKSDRLQGLKLGADDYVLKPFDVDELVLRIRNILKRNQNNHAPPIPSVALDYMEVGNIRFYKASLKIIIDKNKEVILTPREADLLAHFFQNANRVLKREEILHQFWGENDYFMGRSLDVFISRLRKHLKNNDLINIQNIYGVGFVFNVKTPVPEN